MPHFRPAAVLCVLGLILCTVGPGAHPLAGEDPLDDLLHDVQRIAAPGNPGVVCAFGPEAFVVIADTKGRPVVAAASAGKGRAMVLGHGGYCGQGAIDQWDTGRFLANSLRWLSGGKRKPVVACPGDQGLAQRIEALGFRTIAKFDLDEADCVVMGEKAHRERRIHRLHGFVRDGGGVLLAATGWGWQQLNPQKVLGRDLAVNRIAEPFGIACTREYAENPGAEGFAASPRPPELSHAGKALCALAEGEASGADADLARDRVRDGMRGLSDHEPLLILPLRGYFEGGDLPEALFPLRRDHDERAWRPLGTRWSRWWTVGPFAHRLGDRGIHSPLAPEKALRNCALNGPGPDLTAQFRGKGSKVRWRPLNTELDGRDLDAGLVRFVDEVKWPDLKDGWELNTAAFLYRRVEVDEDTKLPVRVGSEDGMRLWCNGELLVDAATSAGIEADERDLVLPLRRGVNHLLVKVGHGDGPWGFRMHRSSHTDQRAIDEAIDRGVAYLLDRQMIDGSWSNWPEYEVGYSALVLYTLLKSGLEPDHPAIRRGLAFVRSRVGQHTYSLSCQILALAAAGQAEDVARLPDLVAKLIGWQENQGLWAYPVHGGGQVLPADLSNTLYVALALRAAHQKGVKVPPRVWHGMIEGALACRVKGDGSNKRYSRGSAPLGFSYRVLGDQATGSMTTAALTVFLAAREGLGKKMDRTLAKEVERALAGGRAWIDREMTWTTNPGKGGWHYFWLYGIERVGALLQTETLGKVNWYWSGATFLIGQQHESGSWRAGSEPSDTVLALLFLSRATAPSTGAKPSRGRAVFTAEDPGDDIHLRAIGRNPVDVWITGYSDRVREEYGARSGTPEIESVRYFARPVDGGAERLLKEIKLGRGGRQVRFEARLAFEEAGRYELVARVTVLRPTPDSSGVRDRRELTSGVLVLEVPGGADWDALEYPLHAGSNLLRSPQVRLEVSSHANHEGARKAVDGNYDTRWRCTREDEAPWWRAKLGKPITATQLWLSHPYTQPNDRGAARAVAVEVIVNGETTFPLELKPNNGVKTCLDFPADTVIQELELRLRGPRDHIGFSEIELLGDS